jgi:hypothetical protein
VLCEARRRSELARSAAPRSTAPREAVSTTTEKLREMSPTSGQETPPPNPAPWLTWRRSLARPSRTRQEKRCEKSRRSPSNSEVTRTGGRRQRGAGGSSVGSGVGAGVATGVAEAGGAAPSSSMGGGGRSADAAMRYGDGEVRRERWREECEQEDTWCPLHGQGYRAIWKKRKVSSLEKISD